jgi:hypothetical protein
MKTFWSWLAKILFVVAIVQAWFLYDFYNKNQKLISENIELETQLLTSQEALAEAQARAEQLEKQSLEGVLKQTNKAVVSGWEKLMNTVEEELQKARDAMPNILGNEQQPSDQSESSDNGSSSEGAVGDTSASTTEKESESSAIQGDAESEAQEGLDESNQESPSNITEEPIKGERT